MSTLAAAEYNAAIHTKLVAYTFHQNKSVDLILSVPVCMVSERALCEDQPDADCDWRRCDTRPLLLVTVEVLSLPGAIDGDDKLVGRTLLLLKHPCTEIVKYSAYLTFIYLMYNISS